MDTEKQRQRRRDDVRLTESRNARSEQLLVVPTELLTNRVWLEWIRTLKARLVFRYEISDFFPQIWCLLRFVHSVDLWSTSEGVGVRSVDLCSTVK